MSLNAHDSDARQAGPKIILKSGDQYQLWRERMATYCWAYTRLDVFSLTDDECVELITAHDEKEDAKPAANPVGICWDVLCKHLSDDLFLKVAHVGKGKIESLISEIRASLAVSTIEDVQPLRVELYGVDMVRDCGGDLQTYISYIISRRNKLKFLDSEVPQNELIHIFIKGLSPVFQPLQVHFAIPNTLPEQFDAVVAIVRKFSNSPAVAKELAKHRVATTNVLAATTSSKEKTIYCRLFAQHGTCRFGDKCKFSHGGVTTQNSQQSSRSPTPTIVCHYCKKKGHVASVCKKRAADSNKETKAPPISLLVEDDTPADLDTEHPEDSFNPIVLMYSSVPHSSCENNSWVCDSGATSSATYNSADCVDIQDCNVTVTAAGSSFTVLKKGTALICVIDTAGKKQQLRVSNCLISERFPYKLLALQSFTSRGFSIYMQQSHLTLLNKAMNISLRATHDKVSRLFLLQGCVQNGQNEKITQQPAVAVGRDLSKPAQCLSADFVFAVSPVVEQRQAKQLLARSYTSAEASNELWKLHLRHGHTNFSDLCRQYGIQPPSNFPVCMSCLMGKSHVYGHDSGQSFMRATRPGEGLHSDVRGPYPVQTPSGCVYLLIIVDDFSRRIFGLKSQTEWYELFPKFVLRIEAELGKQNCISWLLTDNGGIYCAQEMEAFYSSKGIQHRLSAPYSQWMDHTAERNMRTIGEMSLTMLIHANLPRKAWGWATLQAIEILNRTASSKSINAKAGTKSNASRLEKWKGTSLPSQGRGLYPFGCLALKHIPAPTRTKLDSHAVPTVYLGIDANSRAFLLGSIYDLYTSVSIEVTFVEDRFPFKSSEQVDHSLSQPTSSPSTPYCTGSVPVPSTTISATPGKASNTTLEKPTYSTGSSFRSAFAYYHS